MLAIYIISTQISNHNRFTSLFLPFNFLPMKRTELSWSIPPSKKLKVCKNVKALNKAEENIIESSPMSAPSFHSGNENSKSLKNKKKKSESDSNK